MNWPSIAVDVQEYFAGRLFRSERRAVTAVEYGIVAAFLCLSLLGIFRAFGSVLVTMFSGVSNSL